MTKIDKKYFNALKEKMRLEALECGKYGKCKNTYRIIYCKKAKEYTPQIKTGKTWLCLH